MEPLIKRPRVNKPCSFFFHVQCIDLIILFYPAISLELNYHSNIPCSTTQTCHEAGYSAFISLLQPSDDMVTLFDKLLVLTNEGEMSYFGPVDRSLFCDIFLGTTDPEGDNGSIADLVLEASLDKTGQMENVIKRRYDYSTTSQSLRGMIAQSRSEAPKGRSIHDLLPQESYPKSFLYCFKLIAQRRVKLIRRNSVTFMRMTIAVFFGLVIGSLFANSLNNLGGALSTVRDANIQKKMSIVAGV